jgi:hypothetical protein
VADDDDVEVGLLLAPVLDCGFGRFIFESRRRGEGCVSEKEREREK